MTDYSVDKMTIDMVNGTIGSASVKQDGRLVGYSDASYQMTGADGFPRWGVFHTGTEIHFTAEDGGGNRVKKTFTFTPLNDCDAETALLRIKGRVAEVKAWADAIKATVPPETCSVTINGHAVTVTRTTPGEEAYIIVDGAAAPEPCSWDTSRKITDTTMEGGSGILAPHNHNEIEFYRNGTKVEVNFDRKLNLLEDPVRTIACVLKKRAEKVIAAFKELEQNPVVEVLGKSVTLHLKTNGTVGGVTVDGTRYDTLGRRASKALTGIKFLGGGPSIFCPACVGVATPRDSTHTVDWDRETFYGESGANMTPAAFVALVEMRTAAVKRAIAERTPPDPCDCESDVWVGEIRGMSVSVTRAQGAEPVFTVGGTGYSYGNPRGHSSFHFSREVTGTDNEEGLGILQDGTSGMGETKYYRGARSVCVPDIAAIPSRVTMPLGEMMRIVIARADAVCEAFGPCECESDPGVVFERLAAGESMTVTYRGSDYSTSLWELSQKLTGTDGEEGDGIFENYANAPVLFNIGDDACAFDFKDGLDLDRDSMSEICRKVEARARKVRAWRIACGARPRYRSTGKASFTL